MSNIKGTQDGYSYREDFLTSSLTASQGSGATVAASALQMDCEDYTAFTTVLAGTWVGTCVAEQSSDDGLTWNGINIQNVATKLEAATMTANGTYVLQANPAATQVRIRCSAFTSGSISVRVNANKGGTASQSPTILTDPVTGNAASVQQFHNADNQAPGASAYGLLTGGVTQAINAAGNLDRQRETGQDQQPAVGIVTGAAQFALAFTTTDAENKAAGTNTVFAPAAMSGSIQGVPWSIQVGSIVILDINTYVVTLNGSPTGGTFTLSFGGQTTSGIAYNASAATVQTAVTGLSSVGSGNATVSGSAGGPYTITIHPQLAANLAGVTSNGASLTGGTSPSATTARNGEAVVATATTTTTFTATTAKAHNGTSTAVGIACFVYNQERDCTGELSGASGSGTALAVEMHYNSGGPAPGANYDRALNLHGKGYSTGTVSSGGGAGSISVTLSSAPTGLQPGAPVYFTDGTAEVAYTAATYTPAANPILLQAPLLGAHSATGGVGWDVYAAQGPQLSGFSANGIAIEEEALWDPISKLFYIERSATQDNAAAPNIVFEAEALFNANQGNGFERARSVLGKNLISATITAPAQNATSITFSSDPSTGATPLKAGMALLLGPVPATAEIVYVASSYTSGTSVPLAQAVVLAGHGTTAWYEGFAWNGAGLNGFLASGMDIDEDAVYDPVSGLFYLERSATQDNVSGQNVVLESPGLVNNAGNIDRWKGQSGAGYVNTEGQKASYCAQIIGLAPAASATDVFTLTGSGTKTVKVTRIEITGIATGAAVIDVVLVKRSAADTAGTSSAPTIVPYDSNDAAATAVVAAYTANPTTGTLVGNMASAKLALSTSGGALPVVPALFDFGVRPARAVTLRGAQQLAVNLNAASIPAGTALDIFVEWTEE